MRFGNTPIFIAGTRTDSPPAPSGGTRYHGKTVQPLLRWWEHGLCRGEGWVNRSVWINPHKHSRKEIAEAVALCERCPVKVQCAADDGGWCIQGGVAHVARPVESQPRPKKQLVCGFCAAQFVGLSHKFCSDACRRAHHRAGQRAKRGGPR